MSQNVNPKCARYDMSPDRVCLTNWPRNPPPPSAFAVLLIVQCACRCRHVGATCLESPRIMQRVLATWRRGEPSRGGGAVSPCKYQSSHLHPDIYPPPSNEYLKFLTCSPIKAIIAVYKSSSQQLHCCYQVPARSPRQGRS